MSGGAVDLAVAGLGTGAVAALSGLGVLATYRVTGVLNVAFGAIGMIGAYLARALVVDARLPVYAAGLLVVCCFAPLLGLSLEAAVFGPLLARAADAGRLLTAGFGITVLLVGLATAIWGEQARTDAPSLLPGGTAHPAGVDLPAAVPIELFLVLLVALGLGWFSRGGPAVRAVIDDRRLAELAGLPARRLARIGWVAGTMLATLTGVLLAPQLRFDPSTLTLVLFETLGVAVAARLRSAPIAILVAFGTAIGQAELTAVHLPGAAGSVLDAVRSNLFVVLLLLATWATPAFDSAAAPRRPARAERWWPPYALVLALALAGWVLRPADLRSALAVPAFALVLLSFRVLDAGGMLSLGQAGLAGIGALAAGWAPGWGILGAPLAGAAVAALLALPVLRRAGLHLAVATLAAGTALGSFLFDQPLFTPSSVPRPGFAQPDRGYLYLELAVMVLSLLAMTVLVRGPLALRLSALRDSETASRTAGIAVDRERLAVFAAAGALAALGGALWAAGDQVFDPTTAFEPAQGLLWFAAAAAVGFADSTALILTAIVLTIADTYVSGSSAILVGLATLLLPALRSEIRPRFGRQRRGRKPVPVPAPRAADDGAVAAAMACEDVRVRYGGIEVLHGIRLAAAGGTFAALVGPNGAGKTTLLDWCAGAAGSATAPDGRLRLDGREATTWSAAQRARAGLRYVPFEHNVFPGLNVLDNLRAATSPAAATGTPEAVFALFPELERLAARPAGVLSGGERQLLAVACALCGPGRTLLLDEPTHGLAPGLADRVLGELARTARQDGRAVLVAEPSAERFAAEADFLWPLERGRRVAPATGG